MSNTISKNVKSDVFNYKYDKILQFDKRNYTVAILAGKAGIIDSNGKQITSFIYDDLSDEFVCDIGNERGWIHFWSDNDKYIRMRLNGKWGLLDKNGNVVIDFKYNNPVEEWGDNFIIFIEQESLGHKYYKNFIIDKNKSIHAELNFDSVLTNSEYAIVEKQGKFGVVDKNLKMVIPIKYDCLFAPNLIKFIGAQINQKWGIINLQENIIFDFIYDDINIEIIDNKHFFKMTINGKEALYNNNFERIL